MDAACTGDWRTEVSQWGLGAESQWVWGQSTSLAKTPENRCRLHTRCQRGGIGRDSHHCDLCFYWRPGFYHWPVSLHLFGVVCVGLKLVLISIMYHITCFV